MTDQDDKKQPTAKELVKSDPNWRRFVWTAEDIEQITGSRPEPPPPPVLIAPPVSGATPFTEASAIPDSAKKGAMADTQPTHQFNGLLNEKGEYDGLIVQVRRGGGMWLYYMSPTGWIDDPSCLSEIYAQSSSRLVSPGVAAQIAEKRFGQPLAPPVPKA